MGVLADVERILYLHLPLDSLACPRYGGVLVGAYVDNIVVALVLNRTAAVKLLDCIVRSYEVIARARFVAERPYHNRGAVYGGMHKLHVAGYMRGFPLRNMRQRCLSVIVLMRFEVCLIFKINAILVGKIIPVRSIRIVRIAHMVYIGALHHHDLALHPVSAHGMTH